MNEELTQDLFVTEAEARTGVADPAAWRYVS